MRDHSLALGTSCSRFSRHPLRGDDRGGRRQCHGRPRHYFSALSKSWKVRCHPKSRSSLPPELRHNSTTSRPTDPLHKSHDCLVYTGGVTWFTSMEARNTSANRQSTTLATQGIAPQQLLPVGDEGREPGVPVLVVER